MQRKKNNSFVWFTFILLFFSCANVNYIGKSYTPSQHVDVFYSKDDIKIEYSVMGHVIGSGHEFMPEDDIQEALIKEALEKGADAILITGIELDMENSDDYTSHTEKQVKAQFLKYAVAEIK